MDHGTHELTGSSGIDVTTLLIRLLLLLGTAFVAGTGLIRPLVTAVPRRLTQITAAAAAASALLAVLSIFLLDVNIPGAIAHVVLSLAVPVVLSRPGIVRWPAIALVVLVVVETSLGRSGVDFAVDTVYVASAAAWFGITVHLRAVSPDEWRTTSVRLGPLALTLGVLLTLAGLISLGTAGIGFDRRLYETAYGVALLAIVVLPLVVAIVSALALRKDAAAGVPSAYRLGVLGVTVGFLAFGALAAIPKPTELPEPGVPLLADASVAGKDVPVLVSPQRPGRNLVHLPAAAGEGYTVGTEGGLFEPVTTSPGAEGGWAGVDLPAGRGELVLRKGDQETTLQVDTGDGAGPETAAGPDGPECASAALGGLIADKRDVLTECPSDALVETDADALRRLVGFLAERRVGSVNLDSDDSPRSVAAAAVVREAAAGKGIPITDTPAIDSAVVVVSGWASAYTAVSRAAEAQRAEPVHGYGQYLAPWLLNGPVVNAAPSSSLPLRFDPREQQAVQFTVDVRNKFGGESPTLAGYRQWLGPEQPITGQVQIYASAQVNAMPMNRNEPQAPGMSMAGEGIGHWVPGGTVVPVSLPLQT